MAGLVELRASGNQLTELPATIAQLSRLRELHLRDNRLRVVPVASAVFATCGNSICAAIR